MSKRAIPVILLAVVLLTSVVPVGYAQPVPEGGWNIAEAGFAHFVDINIDVDAEGPLPPGFLEVDAYHISRAQEETLM